MPTRDYAGEKYQNPAHPPVPGSVLPRKYTPRVAGYARGPFIVPGTVTPTDIRFRNTRSYRVTDAEGTDYLCVLVNDSSGEPVGYWAFAMLGLPLEMVGGDE